jgi:sugar lactone lactonase YvrE
MWFAAFGDRAELSPPPSDANIQWKIYDIHTFTADDVVQIPDVHWIDDSQIAADGTLWLATTDGLAQFAPAANEWNIRDWPKSEELWPAIDTSSLAIGPDGSIWVGTSSHEKPLALQFVPDSLQGAWHTYDERDGIPDIESIAITPDGKIWFNPETNSDVIVACTLLK